MVRSCTFLASNRKHRPTHDSRDAENTVSDGVLEKQGLRIHDKKKPKNKGKPHALRLRCARSPCPGHIAVQIIPRVLYRRADPNTGQCFNSCQEPKGIGNRRLNVGHLGFIQWVCHPRRNHDNEGVVTQMTDAVIRWELTAQNFCSRRDPVRTIFTREKLEICWYAMNLNHAKNQFLAEQQPGSLFVDQDLKSFRVQKLRDRINHGKLLEKSDLLLLGFMSLQTSGLSRFQLFEKPDRLNCIPGRDQKSDSPQKN